MRFHPSSLGAIMSDPKSMDLSLLTADELAIWKRKNRTDDEQELMNECKSRGLSEGAKTFLVGLAKEMLFDYSTVITGREMEKGTLVEPDSIQLLSHVHFARYTKHVGRRVDDLLTGECDIYVPEKFTRDTKSSWSLDTFPVLSEDCHDVMYEWQGRAYMRLYNVPKHYVDFCMVDTPDQFLYYDNGNLRPGIQVELHKVSHIDPKLRVTTICYERCPILEAKMVRKIRAAQKYLDEVVARIRQEHGVIPDWKKQFLTT